MSESQAGAELLGVAEKNNPSPTCKYQATSPADKVERRPSTAASFRQHVAAKDGALQLQAGARRSFPLDLSHPPGPCPLSNILRLVETRRAAKKKLQLSVQQGGDGWPDAKHFSQFLHP